MGWCVLFSMFFLPPFPSSHWTRHGTFVVGQFAMQEDREKLLRSLAVPEGEEEEVETYQRMTRCGPQVWFDHVEPCASSEGRRRASQLTISLM